MNELLPLENASSVPRSFLESRCPCPTGTLSDTQVWRFNFWSNDPHFHQLRLLLTSIWSTTKLQQPITALIFEKTSAFQNRTFLSISNSIPYFFSQMLFFWYDLLLGSISYNEGIFETLSCLKSHHLAQASLKHFLLGFSLYKFFKTKFLLVWLGEFSLDPSWASKLSFNLSSPDWIEICASNLFKKTLTHSLFRVT